MYLSVSGNFEKPDRLDTTTAYVHDSQVDLVVDSKVLRRIINDLGASLLVTLNRMQLLKNATDGRSKYLCMHKLLRCPDRRNREANEAEALITIKSRG